MVERQRVCIVGTAQSWRETPWNDPTLEVWSLNDSYSLGLPRADRWFEIHPLDRMHFLAKKQRVVREGEIPAGCFVRPAGHIEWLKEQARTIPVYLQDEPPAGWPINAQRFPIERVREAFGSSYWACGPSYMLAFALLEGFTEIWITGIHLATQAEYVEQRPQWEHLLGRALGQRVTESTGTDGWRIYDGLVRIVMPASCPILQHGWTYAYEPKPVAAPDPFHVEHKAATKEIRQLTAALIDWPTGKDKAHAVERLRRLQIVVLDIERQRQKKQHGGTLAITVAA